jgi:hypothetical protein
MMTFIMTQEGQQEEVLLPLSRRRTPARTKDKSNLENGDLHAAPLAPVIV